jgi:hypothetical protein
MVKHEASEIKSEKATFLRRMDRGIDSEVSPVKYNFAHGGKDGVPYPVARKTYDKSISYLSSAIEGAEIEREQRIQALKKLAEYSAGIFN